MWFYLKGTPVENAIDLAIIDKERGDILQPIVGDWSWAKDAKLIKSNELHFFENIYRDAILLLFGDDRTRKKYGRKLVMRRNKKQREEKFERNLKDLQRWSQIVGH